MISDPGSWEQQDRDLLADLLGVPEDRILSHQHSLGTDRKRYFGEIRHVGDLFLDPDTGLAVNSCSPVRRYLKAAELGLLLDVAESRTVAVYQHVRGSVRGRLERLMPAVVAQTGEPSWAAYESGTVALLFFSHSAARIARVADLWRGVLRRQAAVRLCVGNNVARA